MDFTQVNEVFSGLWDTGSTLNYIARDASDRLMTTGGIWQNVTKNVNIVTMYGNKLSSNKVIEMVIAIRDTDIQISAYKDSEFIVYPASKIPRGTDFLLSA